MRIFIILLFFLTLPSFAVTTFTSQLHDIDYGLKKGDDILLLFESGRVGRLKSSSRFMTNKMKDRNSWWKVSLNQKNEVTKIVSIEDPRAPHDVSTAIAIEAPYEPTIVRGKDQAKQFFYQSRRSRNGETQCYNRAHVWAFELWRKYKVKSQKAFLFFSRKYIRQYNFGWWFHVAPLIVNRTLIKGTAEKIIDPHYINAPREISWWTAKFVRSRANCPVITKYSEYADYPYTYDCYVLKAPMYTYQPLDLEMLEVWGVQKNQFSKADLKLAYKEAFAMEYNGEGL